jgi:hypothetical protein
VLLLHGGRRSGKTSALRYLPRRLGPGLVPLLIDLQGAASAGSLRGLAGNLADQAMAAARRGRNLDLPRPDPQALDRDPFMGLQAWMDRVEAALPDKRLLLCSVVVQELNRRHSRRADAALVETVVPDALRQSPYFIELWRSTLNEAERGLLARLVNGEPPDLDAERGLLQRLVRREVLEAADEGVAFQVPMVRRYVELQVRGPLS